MALRESHKASGNNNQTIKVGDIVLIHDDIPWINWKLAMIEELITGNDGLTQAANLRIASGRMNRPIARLYPLEVTAGIRSADVVAEDRKGKTTDRMEKSGEFEVILTTTPNRPRVRESVKRAREQMMKWVSMARPHPLTMLTTIAI